MSSRLALTAVVATLGVSSIASAAPSPTRVAKATEASVTDAVGEYRWFHAHPELSDHEQQTAAHLAAALRKLGLTVHEGIGGHGIVAVLRSKTGANTGPSVLYRADMDGLPIQEATGVAYASQNRGVMHACGHDVHMATAIGVMRALGELSEQWHGTVIFVGQPSEEVGSGARSMLADKRFKKILATTGKPQVAVALHDAADLPAGDVSIIEGFATANADSVDIVIHGKGGHGARPHETIDPIVVASEVVLALQTIVSRRLAPEDKAVVTVGKFEAGTKHNIIPPRATLLLTVRSYSDATRKRLLAEIERIAFQLAKAHGAERAPEITVSRNGVSAGYNDPAWARRIRAQLVAALGKDHVHEHTPSMGAEDFGLFARELQVPGVMFRLGAVDPQRWKRRGSKGLPGLHSDKWAPAFEPAVRTGIKTVTAVILDALQPTPPAQP